MLPIVKLLYVNPNDIECLYQLIFDYSYDELKNINRRYTLISIDSIQDCEVCVIPDVILSDIIDNPNNHESKKFYNALTTNAPSKINLHKTNLFFHSNSNVISTKLVQVLNLALHSNPNIIVQYSIIPNCLMPDIITNTIENNFIICSEVIDSKNTISFIIMKKGATDNEHNNQSVIHAP